MPDPADGPRRADLGRRPDPGPLPPTASCPGPVRRGRRAPDDRPRPAPDAPAIGGEARRQPVAATAPGGTAPPGVGPGPGRGPRVGRGSAARMIEGSATSLALSPSGDRLYTVSGERSEPHAWVFEGDHVREVRWPRRPPRRGEDRRQPRRPARGPRATWTAGSRSSPPPTARWLGSIPAPGEPDPVTALAFSPHGELAVGFRSGADPPLVVATPTARRSPSSPCPATRARSSS